jgi:hypothetical protein
MRRSSMGINISKIVNIRKIKRRITIIRTKIISRFKRISKKEEP